MFALNYDGLKKKDTYDEIIDYLQNKQEKIKYPDRLAKQVRNTPQLSNLLDGDGEDIENINDQQTDKIILAKREQIIKQFAMRNNQTERVLQLDSQTTTIPENFEIYTQTEDGGDSAGDIIEAYGNNQEEQEKAKSERDAKTKSAVMSGLRTTGYIGGGILHLVAKATIGVAQGSMAVASGVASSSLFSGNGGSSDDDIADDVKDDVVKDDDDDLDGKTVPELRDMIREYDYKSIGITARQVKGLDGFRKTNLIDGIRNLRRN